MCVWVDIHGVPLVARASEQVCFFINHLHLNNDSLRHYLQLPMCGGW